MCVAVNVLTFDEYLVTLNPAAMLMQICWQGVFCGGDGLYWMDYKCSVMGGVSGCDSRGKALGLELEELRTWALAVLLRSCVYLWVPTGECSVENLLILVLRTKWTNARENRFVNCKLLL